MKKGYTESVMVQSKTSPLITELRETWYPGGTKQLPFNYIHMHLDEEALAWWYQDDGHLNVQKGMMRKIVLSTDSFTNAENKWLIDLLNNRFHLQFSIDAQNRLLLYDLTQIIRFLDIVKPYLQPCMERKAFHLPPLKPIAKRTTIYLPQEIELQRPTREINDKLQNWSGLFNNIGEVSVQDSVILYTLKQRINPQPMKSYQLCIEDHYRELLAKLRQQTGLTISELVTLCFSRRIISLHVTTIQSMY